LAFWVVFLVVFCYSFAVTTSDDKKTSNNKKNCTMKTPRLYALLALLLMAGGAVVQAQEYPSDLTTIYESDSVWFNTIRNYNDKTFLAFGGNQEENCKVLKMAYNGDILAEAPIPYKMSQWRHGGFYNGKFRYAKFRVDDNDTLPMLCVIELDPEDLSWTYYPCQWEGLDFNHPDNSFLYSEMVHSVFSKDGSWKPCIWSSLTAKATL